MNPRHPDANLMAPESFRVRFTTTRGEFVVEARREWAPNGVDRFFNLVNIGFFDDARFFRVLEGFVAQFGINGDPEVMARWRGATIRDDPVVKGNARGRVVFAQTGSPDSRTTQMFINTADNARSLDPLGFAAVGEVVEGMDVVDALYAGYGEGAPRGRGPDQSRIQTRGNAYLSAEFPQLDHIETAVVIG
jgi:peptidyl-prolyl cis-trans isomerase A (cyclophilin A)